MTSPTAKNWKAADGTTLGVATLGERTGRPVVLLHGLMSSAEINWIKFGTAARLAAAGFRCIMPDLRGHGRSDAPRDPGHWSVDVIMRDVEDLIADEGLTDFDLCGFSLGARIAARLALGEVRPRRLILAGMGLEGFTDWNRRRAFFLDVADRFGAIPHGDPAFFAAAFMKTQGMAPETLRNILCSFSDLPADALSHIKMPTLVLCGTEDRDNGDPAALAEALPDGTLTAIPGNHMNCITQSAFGEAITTFLMT